MKPRDLRTWLHDAKEAAGRILRFMEGMTAERYRHDELVRSAVERQFEIIGEALGKAAQAEPDLPNRLKALPRIVAFRNQLIHGYFAIDSDVVWAIAHDHLPTLITDLEAELEP